MIDPAFELVETEANSAFRCVHKRSASFTGEHPPHYHPAYELTLILRSSGMRFVSDSVERYGPGDLVLSGPNLPHCWRDDPAADVGDAPEWIIAQFDPACLGDGFLGLADAAPLRDLLAAAAGGLSFPAPAAAAVEPMMRRLARLDGLERLVELLRILERLTRGDGRRLAGPGYRPGAVVDRLLIERLDAVQRYIADNLSGEISQLRIAARLGMRPPAFSKYFRAATGRTFTSLVKLTRINEACRRLAATDARITDIALDCGYGHTSHFDGHFQQLKGMRPSEYRRRMRAMAPPPPSDTEIPRY